MKLLRILRGVPGSGKSTYAKTLQKEYIRLGYTVAHYEEDMYFIKEDGYYAWNPKLLDNARRWCQNSVRRALSCCDVVIVSNTTRFKKDVDDYIAIANECGADYIVTRLTGKFKNVHDVPEDTVKQMEDTLEPYPGEEVRCPG